jgi:hypothetical protein
MKGIIFRASCRSMMKGHAVRTENPGTELVAPPANNRFVVPTLIQPSQVRVCAAASLRVGALLHGGRAAA